MGISDENEFQLECFSGMFFFFLDCLSFLSYIIHENLTLKCFSSAVFISRFYKKKSAVWASLVKTIFFNGF